MIADHIFGIFKDDWFLFRWSRGKIPRIKRIRDRKERKMTGLNINPFFLGRRDPRPR